MVFTHQGGHRNAVGCSTVEILVTLDTSETNDSIDEGLLLRSTVHSIGVSDLDRAIITVVGVDKLSTLCSLLRVGGRKCLGLRSSVEYGMSLELR
jgi:hypothetical protein